MTVLLLGGTAEARTLAAELEADGLDFVSSLAGRVSRPRLPVGAVRIGGFGGVEGLVEFLHGHDITAVVDATHPFAEAMSSHAVEACTRSDVPLLRFTRPGWRDVPGSERWHWSDGHEQAASNAARLGSSVLLTIGRQALGQYVPALKRSDVVARVVEPVREELPDGWKLVLDRGPYSLDGELLLMRRHRIDVLVTKDSGGDYTRAKLDAAAELGIEVVVVRRPRAPADRPVECVSDVGAAVRWLRARSR